MSQALTKRNFTRGSLRDHEDARTVLRRMALDEDRAGRIKSLKEERPDLTWSTIADKVGVTERSAIDWQRTGGISHANCIKLAKVFGVDVGWLWSGAEQGTPDLLGALNGDRSQLDRIEDLLKEILSRLPAEELFAGFEEAADQPDGQQGQSAAKPQRKTRSRKAS